MVAGSEDAHGAVPHQAGERPDGLLQRYGPVLDVGVVQVHPVGAEPSQTAVDGVPYGLLAQPFQVGGPLGTAGRVGAGTGLGGQHRAVPGAPAAQPASEQQLALVAGRARHPAGVVVGGVQEGAARLGEAVEDGERGRFVDGGAERQGAQAQDADRGPGTAAEGAVAHVGLLQEARRGSVHVHPVCVRTGPERLRCRSRTGPAPQTLPLGVHINASATGASARRRVLPHAFAARAPPTGYPCAALTRPR